MKGALRPPLRAFVLSLAALAVLGGCASSEIVNASWRSVPSGDDMADAYPGFAAALGLRGSARLTCQAQPDGRLADCKPDRVRPSGLGFDQAALDLVDRFRTVPRTRDGAPVASEVRFTVRFELAPDDPPPPWTGVEPSAEALSLAREIAPRFTAPLTQGPGAVSLDGLPADRVVAVQSMVQTLDQTWRSRRAEATALAMARTVTVSALEMLRFGNRRPPRPNLSDAELASAGDRLSAVDDEAMADLRARYCARYDCTGPRARKH